MNRKRITAFLAALCMGAVSILPAYSYNSYSQGRVTVTLKADSDYFADMQELFKDYRSERNHNTSEDFAAVRGELIALVQEHHTETVKQTNALNSQLIDYDVAVKRLTCLTDKYYRRKALAEEYAAGYTTGSVSKDELDAVNAEKEKLYYEIKELLFDVSVMKTDIEKLIGGELSGDFNFDKIYLITDAIALSEITLTDFNSFSSLCEPPTVVTEQPTEEVAAEAETEKPEAEKADFSAQMNAAIKSYYTLGTALREYFTATAAYRSGAEDNKLGKLTSAELNALLDDKDSKYISAVEGKADYAKALMALDDATGGTLSESSGVSAELAEFYDGVFTQLPADNCGIWKVCSSNGRLIFCPMAVPSVVSDCDYYTISYNGETVGSAHVGAYAYISDFEYVKGENIVKICFTKGSDKVKVYKADIFAPMGEFCV